MINDDEDFDPYDLLQQHDTLILGAHANILRLTEAVQARLDEIAISLVVINTRLEQIEALIDQKS